MAQEHAKKGEPSDKEIWTTNFAQRYNWSSKKWSTSSNTRC